VSIALVSLVAVAAFAEDRGWTPDLALKVKRVGVVLPSPDGSRAAFVVSEAVSEGEKSEWVSQINVANADGSRSFQLTRGEKSSTQPRWLEEANARKCFAFQSTGAKPNS
jgi:hypothetical protein